MGKNKIRDIIFTILKNKTSKKENQCHETCNRSHSRSNFLESREKTLHPDKVIPIRHIIYLSTLG